MKDLIYSYKGDILTEETVEPMLLDILGKAEGRGYSRLLCHYLRSVMMEVFCICPVQYSSQQQYVAI